MMPRRWTRENLGLDSEGGSKCTEDTNPAPSHEERQLHVYNTLMEAIQRDVEGNRRQNTRGISLIIIVIGYSIQFGPETILAIIPGILAYLFIRNAESQVWMMTFTRHIIELEKSLSPPDSAFRFETRRGGLISTDQDGLLRDIPAIFRIIAAGIAYVASIWYVTEIIWMGSTREISGIYITSRNLCLIYLGLTAIIALFLSTTIKYRRDLQKDALNSLDQ
jgi:hypothetical protein